MRICRTLAAVKRQRGSVGCVATVGAYDGVHRGHQAILDEVKAHSKHLGLPSAVFSFEPMPKEYLRPNDPPARLSRFREKFKLLDGLGVDEIFCPRFDESMRQLDPETFIRQLLVDGLNVKHLVVGDDFKFAAQRAGTIEDLRHAGKQHGFDVSIVPPVFANDERISSTAVRRALADGDLDAARTMLGRDYMMSGRVVHGHQLGRALGFPTANIPVKRRKTATMGIFAVRVHGLAEGTLEGVANLGTRPTVGGGGEALLEVFIFDFDRDIYGAYLDVDMIARLRDELKFPDLDSMIVQMHKDVARAKGVLAESH
ncbi:MAG: bifunctional riboflavin kinase/FAD synthetase [Gammaproteobacteria bacterium]